MNKKQQIEIVITSILVIVLGVLVFPYLTGQSKIPSAKLKPGPTENQNTTAPEENLLPLTINRKLPEKILFTTLEEAAQQITFTRDPFNPIAQESQINYSLQGILWEQDVPMAIINNQDVKIGDKIQSATVVDIKKDAVFLNTGKKIIELKLHAE